MKPEHQRIAIAEACGAVWKAYDEGRRILTFHRAAVCAGGTHRWDLDGSRSLGNDIPDYPNDLNAMHEAEKVCLDQDYLENFYNSHLLDATNDADERWWMATAAQRAEAFLKTIGKWEGGES